LDEPTNHLDLESLLWFQEYLQGYPGAILMISHDREFLNALIGRVVEIAWQRLHVYAGNYDDYLREKEARAEQHRQAYENQQKEIAKLQDFADRFRAKASKAAQAQSKLKQIERMEKIEAPLEQAKTVAFRFPQPPRSGQRVMALRGVDFAYGELVVYRGLDYEVERGQRTVLVGPNGAGKSTMLKLLAGMLVPQGGERVVGHNVRAGYFAQNRTEMLQPNRTVLAEAMDVENRQPEQFVRTLLGSFLFSGDDVLKPVAVLSGGEKSRLALVKLLLDPPNLLLMDEPTTHLDIASIDTLVAALSEYQGTLVFVSHDVHFIRCVATRVVHVNGGRLTPYAGDYDYYLEKTRAGSARAALTAPGDGRPAARGGGTPAGSPAALTGWETNQRERRQQAADARKALASQKRLVRELEEKIAALEQRQAALTAELERPETYAASGRAMVIHDALRQVVRDLESASSVWEAAATRLSDLEAAEVPLAPGRG
ncbi:MAG: ABC-F family ATP-binding cassette domain-containing protein, partial [Verrucomicrobiota bacterium]